MGDLQQAKQYLEKALAIYTEQLGFKHVHVGMCYNNLGNVHQDLGDRELANQYYNKARKIYIYT